MRHRFLIVDDSPAMQAVIERVIRLSGFRNVECITAPNGQAALDVLAKSDVDVILTDLNMPKMSGEELLRYIQRCDALRRTPVLVISTDGTGGRVQRMLELGARGYLTKPFTPEDLRRQLEKVFAPEPVEKVVA